MCKCAHYDLSCRQALKHHSFIHSFVTTPKKRAFENSVGKKGQKTGSIFFFPEILLSYIRGPTWLTGKVFESKSRGPWFAPLWIWFFFVGVFLGKTLQSPGPVPMKPKKDMNNVSCRCDMTEILYYLIQK